MSIVIGQPTRFWYLTHMRKILLIEARGISFGMSFPLILYFMRDWKVLVRYVTSNSKKTDKHAEDCSKAVCLGVK